MKDLLNTHRQDYLARINRVMDYIDKHLAKTLDLDTLADVACFSRYHFHRIFRALVGEPVNQYVQRVRIEKSASLLVHNPQLSITEIALQCGFSSSATFARAFKEAFGVSASIWRTEAYKEHRKNRKTKGNLRKADAYEVQYLGGTINHLQWKITMNKQLVAQVEVKDFPEMHLAYVRHMGPYAGNEALFGKLINQLMQWAAPRGLANFPETQMLSVYHDDPHVTDESQLRLTVAITVPPETKAEGKIGRMTIPAGRYAVARFEIAGNEYEKAWQSVYQTWLPESGFQPADGPSLELYQNDPDSHPEKKHIVDICVPVVPL